MDIKKTNNVSNQTAQVKRQLNRLPDTNHASTREELQAALEQLQSVQTELEQKTQLLQTAQQTIAQNQLQLRAMQQAIHEQVTSLSRSSHITEHQQEAQFYRVQRLESLGILASSIAHDLKNVLTPILSMSQLLRLNQPGLDARSQEMLKVIEDSAKHGANMVKQILAFMQGAGEERSSVSINPLVQEVLDVARQTFPRSIVIQQKIPDQWSGAVLANSTHLHQVLMNLCMNARDAMPEGGLLTLAVNDCFVDQALLQNHSVPQTGRYVVITVADTGTGIAPELRDRIFEPFFTTKPAGQGTGLGLAMVWETVKNYGGFVEVLSEVEVGTAVKIYLPALNDS